MSDYRTFRQHGFDLDAARAVGGPVFFQPTCGYATGLPEDVPDGWELVPMPSPNADLAVAYGAMAVADMAFGREDAVYESARRAARYARATVADQEDPERPW